MARQSGVHGKRTIDEKDCPKCGHKMRLVMRIPGKRMYWVCQNVKENTKNWTFDVLCDHREVFVKE